MPPEPRRAGPARGFTLIEVLAAMLILALVGTALLSQVTDLTEQLRRSRDEDRAAAAGERYARELLAQLQGGGEIPEPGTQTGRFETEDEDLTWELEVEAYAVPLPGERAADRALSSVFTEPGGRRGEEQPSLRRLVLRVFREDLTGERVEAAQPFVLFAVEPPSEDELATGLAPLEPEEPEP